jgi:Ni/Co efflux regulator RcnB
MTKEMPMIKLFTVAAAACLLAVSPALADRHDHGSGGGGSRSVTRTTIHTTTVHSSGVSLTSGHSVSLVHGGRSSSFGGGGRTRSFTRTTTGGFHGHAFMSHRTVANFRSFRRNFNAPRRFHFGLYNRPHGWYAHRWVYGERLPGGWYGRNYWIGNYATFGLIGPPDGYQWVRDGDDALLVDVDTGEVLQVEYGVFY